MSDKQKLKKIKQQKREEALRANLQRRKKINKKQKTNNNKIKEQ